MLQYQYRTSQMHLVGLQIFFHNFWLKSRVEIFCFVCQSRYSLAKFAKILLKMNENPSDLISVLSHCCTEWHIFIPFTLFISSQLCFQVPSVFLSYYQRVTSIRLNTDGEYIADISRSLALTAELYCIRETPVNSSVEAAAGA